MPEATKKAVKKPAPAHPPYIEMIKAAITALKERNGSSRQQILKYIEGNNKVGDNAAKQVKLALRRGVEKGSLIHTKGKGASGSFKVVAKEASKPKKDKTVKSKPKKTTKPKPKKSPAKKSTKAKAASKSPKKPATKPKVKKPKAKTTTKKSPAKKASKAKSPKKPAAKKAPKKTAAKK